MQSANEQVPIGSAIAGRYRIEAALGRGGMGVVYGVLDEGSGRRVALKRLRCERPEDAVRVGTLFEREYHTLKQLAHPCIVEAYDFGVDEAGPYYTMELLPGSDVLRLAPMPWQQACAVLRDIASALALIHSRRLVHRDLSPRNVRCTADGKAKLIDFGALASIGACGELIGTAPLMAPETVHRQPVDGRADIYSLGALAYFLLSGRHAYAADTMSALSELWQSWPAPLSSMVPDLPRALETLVFSMINLDPLARPSSIAEVIERLMVIGDLPAADDPGAARWYLLSMPGLVGRDDALTRLRKQVQRAVRGQGSAAIVEAASGLGKSRLLQAIGLDARLAGATVIQVAAERGSTAPHATADALAAAVIHAQPELALAAAHDELPLLAHALPALRARRPDCEPKAIGPGEEVPGMVQQAVCQWLLRLSQRSPLVITVDDAERADDASLWILAALARRAHESRIAITLALDDGAACAHDGALAIFRRHAHVLQLAALDASQSDALVRSVLGDVPNLKAVAVWVRKLSDGSPRSCMELIEHLLDRGVVRYERGSFVVPSALPAAELPASLGEAIARTLADLPPLARELAQTLALAKSPLALAEYARALGLPPQQSEAVFTAIDALVCARVLVLEGELYRFRHQGYPDAARRTFPDERGPAVHRRLSEVFEARGDIGLQAAHLLEAGDVEAALASVLKVLAQTSSLLGLGGAQHYTLPTEQMPWLRDPREVLRLLDLGLGLCEQRGYPEPITFKLRTALLTLATISDVSKMRGHVSKQLQVLARLIGAADRGELAPASAPLERAQRCLANAQQLYEATPESERILTPSEAIGSLMIHAGQAQSYARQAFDLPLIETLTELTGCVSALSPALDIMHVAAVHTLELVKGRHEHAAQARATLLDYYSGLLAAADAPHPMLFLGYALAIQQEGLYRCMRGGPSALEWAQKLEDSKWWRWLGPDRPPDPDTQHVFVRRAWEIRRLCHVWNGNAREADACLAPIEQLSMRHAHAAAYGGGGALLEAQACAISADLMGLKQCVGTIVQIVERQYPGWTPCLDAARGHYLRLRGDLDGAIEHCERAIAQTGAGRHPAWPLAATGLVEALHAKGDFERALSSAREALEQCQRAELGASAERDLERVLALAEASALDPALGAARLEQRIERELAAASCGLMLGVLYETRAAIALLQDDAAAFERFAQLTATQYRPGRNPALVAKYEQLIDAARARGLGVSAELPRATMNSLHSALSDSTCDAITRLDMGANEDGLYRHALKRLVEATGAQGGLVYGLQGDAITLIASVGADAPSSGLEAALRGYATAEIATSRQLGSSDRPPSALERSAFGRYQPLLLTAEQDGRTVRAGVAALITPLKPPAPSNAAAAALGRLLLDLACDAERPR